MITFHALGVKFRLPLLTLIVPPLAARLGMDGGTGVLMVSLGVHELAHIAAAKLTRVEIREICLMPFGGSARMENPYHLSAGQLITVSISGPIANLCLAVLASTLAQWKLLNQEQALIWLKPNLVLFLFNLLPALPLDGGRIIYALLQRPLGERSALRTGLLLGRLLAAMLLAFFLFSGMHTGIWNLSFLLAAIFIFCSGEDERSALQLSQAQRMQDLLMNPDHIHRIRIYQMDISTRTSRALKCIRPRERAWFVITEKGQPRGILDSRSLLCHLIENETPDAAIGELPYFCISPAQSSSASVSFIHSEFGQSEPAPLR